MDRVLLSLMGIWLGLGYRQKSVIEYVNAATIDYLKRFLLS